MSDDILQLRSQLEKLEEEKYSMYKFYSSIEESANVSLSNLNRTIGSLSNDTKRQVEFEELRTKLLKTMDSIDEEKRKSLDNLNKRIESINTEIERSAKDGDV